MNGLTTLSTMIEAEQTTEISYQAMRQVRPWVRYFARTVDVFLFAMLVGIAVGLFAPSVLDLPSAFITVAILFIWIFQESILLANCGTTPGKWFFRIKVRNSRGEKLTFSEALNRSFGVWLKGMGAGVPLLSLLTLIGSRSKLKRDGVTAWDEEGGFIVTHGKIGMLRSAVAVVLLLGFYSLAASGNALQETEDFGVASNSVESPALLVKPTHNIVTGKYDTYSIEYDSSTWVLQREVGNADAEYEFRHCNGDAYAVLIHERTPIPIGVLEAVVIENLQRVAFDVRVLSKETIQLDGQTIVSMQYEGSSMTVPFMFHAYLSSSKHGSLQFITYVSKHLSEEYRGDCRTLLCGLSLSGSEPQRSSQSNHAAAELDPSKRIIVHPKAGDNAYEASFRDVARFADKWLETSTDTRQ